MDKSDDMKIPTTKVEKFYEDSSNTINISIDDVCVKKQKRPKDIEIRQDSKTHYVRNIIVHIEKTKKNIA